jgi:hypothetical protein
MSDCANVIVSAFFLVEWPSLRVLLHIFVPTLYFYTKQLILLMQVVKLFNGNYIQLCSCLMCAHV